MSILLILHVTLMVASLGATIASTIASVFGIPISKVISRTNLVVTATGITFGAMLLVQEPLGVRCAVLLGYLLAFSAAQVYISRRNQRLATSES